jgi:hypothetical protein
MQVSTYVSTGDYETLSFNKPFGMTTPQFFAEILREKAESLRKTPSKPGGP